MLHPSALEASTGTLLLQFDTKLSTSEFEASS